MTLPLRPSRAGAAVCQRRSAQAIVEAALILPVMIVLLVGIVDFGRIFYHQIELANAARDGARVGSSTVATDAEIRAATTAAAASISSSPLFSCCTITPASPRTSLSGQTLAVTVSYAMPLITPGASEILRPLLDVNGRLPLSQTVRMVLI